MCKPFNKPDSQVTPLINAITRSAMQVLDEEGLINFRVGRIISGANCSSKTFYQAYEDKSDLLLCMWVRDAVANQLAMLDTDKHQLDELTCLLLPFLLTLNRRDEHPIALHAISTSINASIWSSVDSAKSRKVKARINFFWQWVRHYALTLHQQGRLASSEAEVLLLCDKLSYLLRGFVWVNDSQLVAKQYRVDRPSPFLDILASELNPLLTKDELDHAIAQAFAYIKQYAPDRQPSFGCESCRKLTDVCEQRWSHCH